MYKKQLFAILAITACSVVNAESPFSKIDTDQNGAISKKEAAALPTLSKEWDTYDSNTDGMLDEAEFAKFEPVAPAPKPE